MDRYLWTQKHHFGPAARRWHCMAYDAARQRTVLFSGNHGGTTSLVLSDTWVWDGAAWTQVADSGPLPRSLAAMAYDAGRRRTVLFDGRGGSGALGDTWEWDGEYWTQVSDTGPSPRSSHKMVYDATRQRVLLFGGALGAEFAGDTWEWDGDEWTQLEDAGPGGRSDHAMAYDPERQCVVLFGGIARATSISLKVLGDTWEWVNGGWHPRVSFGPGLTAAGAMAYSGRSVLLFGGLADLRGPVPVNNNTWEWDGHRWRQQQDMGPSPRCYFGLVYDSARKRPVLYGGVGGSSLTPVIGDTWEWYEYSRSS
jgi:hypothetical protein